VADEPGAIEKAVLSDLQKIGELTKAGQATNAALAIKLARVLDARGDDEPASQTAKAVDTLRITMSKLTEAEYGDPDEKKRLGALLSSPNYGGSEVSATVRYPPQSGTADPRRRRRKDRDGAG
jgi:hypothetical protein